jgi:hypothetical protein
VITEDPRVLGRVTIELGNCVYVLVDPRDSTPFYVGKGVGTRMLQHGIDAARLTASSDEAEGEGSRKLQRIQSDHDHVVAAWLPLRGAEAVVSYESALEPHELSDVIPTSVHLSVPRVQRGATGGHTYRSRGSTRFRYRPAGPDLGGTMREGVWDFESQRWT